MPLSPKVVKMFVNASSTNPEMSPHSKPNLIQPRKGLNSSSSSSRTGAGSCTNTNISPFRVPHLLQLYRQALYLAIWTEEGNNWSDASAAVMSKFQLDDFDTLQASWQEIKFDPPSWLIQPTKPSTLGSEEMERSMDEGKKRLKLEKTWKNVIKQILCFNDLGFSAFQCQHDGVILIAKLLHDHYLTAQAALEKWDKRDFPKMTLSQDLQPFHLSFLCRRYKQDIKLIFQAMRLSVLNNSFELLDPRVFASGEKDLKLFYHVPRPTNKKYETPEYPPSTPKDGKSSLELAITAPENLSSSYFIENLSSTSTENFRSINSLASVDPYFLVSRKTFLSGDFTSSSYSYDSESNGSGSGSGSSIGGADPELRARLMSFKK